MKYNLIQLTQNILGSLNSDQVNSISDTDESLQVAEMIRTTYFNMLSKYDLPENNQLFQLDGSGNDSQPVLMYKPEGISKIDWVKYFDSNPQDGQSQNDQFGAYDHDLNTDIVPSSPGWVTTSTTSNTIGLGAKTFTVDAGLTAKAGDGSIATSGANSIVGTVTSYSGTTLVLNITSSVGSGTYTTWSIDQDIVGSFGPGYIDVKELSIQDFLRYTNRLDPTQNNVATFTLTIINQASGDPNSFTFNFETDHQPKFFCVISDYYVVFDAYDNTQDITLQPSKTQCYGWVLPSFDLTDGFTPNLDDNMFPLLLNEAKSLAFLELKQMTHTKAEQEIQRQLSSLQRNKAVTTKPTYFEQLPDFGRRGAGWM